MDRTANFTDDPSAASSSDAADATAALYLQLTSAAASKQFQVIQELAAAGETGRAALMRFLQDRQQTAIAAAPSTSKVMADVVAGKVYQVLLAADEPAVNVFLQTHFATGIVPLHSDADVDYLPLQQLLAKQDFQAADQLTLQKLCELAGAAAVQRKWLYFTEVDQVPVTDLRTINALWLVHSEGKFGFSVQREIWLSLGKNWDRFWPKIGWKTDNNWTRYPQEFTWSLAAPNGHLPLSNQLRGVRVIAALLAHPAWTQA